MTPQVKDAVQQTLAHGRQIAHVHSVGGGCINKAWQLTLDDQSKVFVKEPNGKVLADHFQVEADGLNALAKPQCIRIPNVLGLTQTAENMPLLILEHIPTGSQGMDFQTTLGKQLATLHRKTTQQQYGWQGDNLLGATPQSNRWSDDWVDFVRRHRLGYQFKLARRNGHVDSQFMDTAQRLLDRLDTLLDCDEPACLLHGDLWAGNVMCDDAGNPVLVDPGVYYGQREADLAMTHLFGGFTPEFYQAYHDTWPLPDGTMQRQRVYMLYHLLNHLNLFGRGYFGQCNSLMHELLAA
ncbi:MAG TPA: hypothetical protein DCM28_00040 [Phycisphaerales bacterium]|nr:hypothetical protein [Phycisphaerales bacterium]HCD31300.1 hypothetical protein [Phycisphaerales bacterium]|tara:strand:+ start:196 stop:1080 length:885 start_codon:yes stop_codon:yes gene_type:complete